MRKLLLFFLLFSGFNFLSFSQGISLENIKTVAANFFFEKIQAFKNIDYASISVKEVLPVYHSKNKNLPAYYILNMNPDGFVVISNSVYSKPVLAYSFEGSYTSQKQNPSFESWMRKRANEIDFLNHTTVNKNPDWITYLTKPVTKSQKAMLPLLFSKWDQVKYYNSLCPADSAGPDGHVVTGCVATAMAQIMYYHHWPWSGTGSYSYQDPPYGTISANFDSAHYNYNEMNPVLTSYNYSAALLLFHIGVTVDMVYGPNGSGMWNHKAAYSFKTYFKYNPNTRYIFRDSTTLNWDSIVIANLDARKPLYYAGWEDSTFTSGHAFVCDGYQDHNYYHFNWGWGGYLNGYFYSDQLNPGGSNFSNFEELIVDIYPDTNQYVYPIYCSNDTLNFSSGTISSENGNSFYKPNSTCTWLIQPTCGRSVQLQFNTFSIADGDTLFAFDGEDDAHPVIQYFTSQNPAVPVGLSGATTVKSTSNNMFLLFKTDGTNEDFGFSATYTSKYCNIDTLTSSTGIVSDGSGICNYNNSTNCRWLIMPPSAQSLKLTFTSFDLANNNSGDFLVIYKNSISTSNTIATLNASNPPSGSIYIPSGKAILRFVTNTVETAGGWELNYEDITNSPQYEIVNNQIIYPNPVNQHSIISISENNVPVSLYDITGKCMGEVNSTNEHTLSLSAIAPHLKPGVYFLQINHNSTKKVVCIHEY
jgi:hypothetical protein